jgi:hypothetical protein
MIGLLGCCSCGSTTCTSQTVTINTKCRTGPSSGTTVTGVFVEILDGATVLKSGTTNFTGSVTLGTFAIPGAGTYTLRLSKTGYTTTESPIVLTCGGAGLSQDGYFCLTSISYRVYVYGQVYLSTLCPLEDVTVTLSGDISDSGTTNSSGYVDFTISVPANNCAIAVTLTMTPVSGRGIEGGTASDTIYPCLAPDKNVTLYNDASHAKVICGTKYYYPLTGSYSDDDGSCTVTYDGFGDFTGNFSYSFSPAIKKVGITCTPDQTVDIPAEVNMSTSGCGGAFTVTRICPRSIASAKDQLSDNDCDISTDAALTTTISQSCGATITVSGTISSGRQGTRNFTVTFTV